MQGTLVDEGRATHACQHRLQLALIRAMNEEKDQTAPTLVTSMLRLFLAGRRLSNHQKTHQRIQYLLPTTNP